MAYWKDNLENSKWGNKFIKNLSIDLKLEFPNIKSFSTRNLKYMQKFAHEYPKFEFVQQVAAQIPWGHNLVLLDKIKNKEAREWYIKQSILNGWSRNILDMQISSNLYERQAISEKITNFENTLPDIQSDLVIQTLKEPYIFDFILLKGKVKESEIEQAMIEKIKDVLIELGSDFAFVGNQYKITVGDNDYFIDLLFYHLKLKCYIVVELKSRKFMITGAGRLNFYLSAIDDLIKNDNDNPTIGLILCKSKDKFTAEYALKDINKPIGVSGYKLLENIQEYLEGKLPKIKYIELHIKF